MSLIQFVRIFWVRRWLIVAATISCLIGAMILTRLLPPRWESHARVMMGMMKPDPVTGQMIGSQEGRVYASTQIELIKDNSIAGQVAEQLGWLTDPQLLAAYQKRSKSDQRDFRSWLSQIIIDGTKANLIEDSNILDISYTGSSAANAKGVSETLRRVYLQDSVLTRREDAERNAEWYQQQQTKARTALDDAIKTETDYERANGVAMANDKVDLESARLQSLSANAGLPSAAASAPAGISAAAMELAQIDSQITAASKVLGPNNPEMQALRIRRASIATIASEEKSAAQAAANGANAGRGAIDQAINAQTSKVIADSPKIGRLAQLQNDVDLRRDELGKLSQKLAQYREEALVNDSGMVPLGPASTPKAPSFPNYPLIIAGGIALGGGLGVLVALLMELLARRVRGIEDLSSIKDLPVVGVIGAPHAARRKQLFARLSSLGARRSQRGKAITA